MVTNTKPKHANKLIEEKSPYLLQHAHNPVEWYPWGKEAFIKAQRDDKPIFLSIGYSTCHWCHVMAQESFENEEVAAILNEHYVSIKVDREERPDIDQIYMTACQAMTGQGGWPLTIIMTPDKKPFFAGTYFPKRNKWGRLGLIDILQRIAKAWKEDREGLVDVSNRVTDILRRQPEVSTAELGEDTIKLAFQAFSQIFDYKYGGFGSAPKFPTPHHLLFLMRYWAWTRDDAALKMVEETLDIMAAGGIFDHIGYGFHRYSTDSKWLVPHFEKMLYDNALLAYAYLEAYQATDKAEYAQVATKIFDYIRREMTSPEGGFYSAEDADTEGVEGKFYVFTPEEVLSILGEEDGKWFCSIYDITEKGNFEGKSIPNLLKSRGKSIEDPIRLSKCRDKLFDAREKRTKPHKDDKILTSWNGLMIAALAKGARVLKDHKLAKEAERAVEFIFNNLLRQDGRLLARFRDGEAAYLGYLDDYAFMVWGLLELYEATFNPSYLRKALQLTDSMLELFWDHQGGGMFFYGSDSEELIVRPKEIYDGATPSGNSVAALNLIRLSRITGDERYESKAEELFLAFAGEVASHPTGYSFLLLSLLTALMPSKEIVIVGDPKEKDTHAMLEALSSLYLPTAVTILKALGDAEEELEKMAPYLHGMKPLEGKATVYVCENFACREPTSDINKLIKSLQQ